MPAGLVEITHLRRTLWRRRYGVLPFFDYHASSGPTEAINGRLEVLRRNASASETSPTTDGAHHYIAALCTHSSMHSDSLRAALPRRQ
ncbi:MAG: transposase [Actinomycetia bacterium]|nr:transposase [Actinomycetes bacterium]